MSDHTCTADDCDRKPLARGLCGSHYRRWRVTGDPNRYCPCGKALPIELGAKKYCAESCRPSCTAPECERPGRSRSGLCSMHALQARRGGELKPSSWASDWVCVVCGADVEKGSGRRRHCSGACQQIDSRYRKSGETERPNSFNCQLCGKLVCIKRRGSDGRLQRNDTQWCRDCGRGSPEAMRFKRYGVTPDQYREAAERGCEICGVKGLDLHVDHDHKCCGPRKFRTCGACVRGLICGPCNRALGMFQDEIPTLISAISYLSRSQERMRMK